MKLKLSYCLLLVLLILGGGRVSLQAQDYAVKSNLLAGTIATLNLGAPASDAEYGIVRNHIYDININSIGGYGSPVYTGTEFIEYPQVSDQESYVAAKINILSWRLVSQSVNIQPQN